MVSYIIAAICTIFIFIFASVGSKASDDMYKDYTGDNFKNPVAKFFSIFLGVIATLAFFATISFLITVVVIAVF